MLWNSEYIKKYGFSLQPIEKYNKIKSWCDIWFQCPNTRHTTIRKREETKKNSKSPGPRNDQRNEISWSLWSKIEKKRDTLMDIEQQLW